MVRQLFERKSLWHLSAPCYHIHISMGDNFESACTALRSIWLGPAKMKQSLPAFFKAFLGQCAFQRHPQLVWRATPEAVGTIDLLLIRESNQGGEGPFPGRGEVWVAANIGIGQWTVSSSRVPHGKYWSCPSPSSPLAPHRWEGGIRASTRHQLGGWNFKQRPCYSN